MIPTWVHLVLAGGNATLALAPIPTFWRTFNAMGAVVNGGIAALELTGMWPPW